MIDCLRLSSCQGGSEEGLAKDGTDSGGREAEGDIKKIAGGCGVGRKYIIVIILGDVKGIVCVEGEEGNDL